MSTSIYNIPLKTWDGKDHMLENYQGKVSLVINVTTECGNAPEYRIIEDIYQKYKGEGFEVIAVPTNQYCGRGIIYDEFVDGINCALDAKNYAETKHGVTYSFSELVNSTHGQQMDQEEFKKLYPDREVPFPVPLAAGEEPHPIFQYLNVASQAFMFGNFEKYLIDRRGLFVQKYTNGCLMPRVEEIEYANKFGLDAASIGYDRGNNNHYSDDIASSGIGQYFYNTICDRIESLL